jgi:nucleotide-binding universal stress UspA family protein
MLTLKTILFATDFSDCSEYAFHLACALARDHGSKIIVLHVVPPPVAHGEVVARRQEPNYYDELWRTIRRYQAAGIGIDHRIEDGQPPSVIQRVADAVGCDLIVMGTHGRSGLGRLLMGSVAEQVVRGTHLPVLTVKAAPEASQPGRSGEESAPKV